MFEVDERFDSPSGYIQLVEIHISLDELLMMISLKCGRGAAALPIDHTLGSVNRILGNLSQRFHR